MFRPKIYQLFCPTASLHSDRLNRIPATKYLGYLLSEDQSDDVYIAKQMRTLYVYGLIKYYECLVIALSMSRWNCLESINCSSLSCCFMWFGYRRASFKIMTVAFKNVHRRML